MEAVTASILLLTNQKHCDNFNDERKVNHMELFEAYDKYVKPDDDAQAAALAEQAKKEDNNLWEDGQSANNEDNVADPQKDVINKTSTLSEAEITAIAQKMVELMGQKGGNDGNAGDC